MFIDYDEEITFLATNIPKELENITNSVSKNIDESFETNDQRQAYNLGVQNTLSILKQLLNNGRENNVVVFYCPDVEIAEEMDIEEVIEYVSKLQK